MKEPADISNRHTNSHSKLIGSGLALLFHLLLFLFLFTTGFSTFFTIPQDQGILVEFLPDPIPTIPQAIPATEPLTPNPDPNQEVQLVQQATHTEEIQSQTQTQESTIEGAGDIEILEPTPPKPIDQRALYRSRNTGDTLAEQSSRVASATIQAGPLDGNTREGNPDGTPSAILPGRDVVGSLPLPEYTANTGGTVVVQIKVDQYGAVTGASINPVGTTVSERALWDAAVHAAQKAKFNVSAAAPVVQEGTITYVFTLK